MLESFHLNSSSSREPLRIGLILDSLSLPAWITSILDHIEKSNFARIELIIKNAAVEVRTVQRAALPVRIWKGLADKNRRGRILYDLYTRYEANRFAPQNN